MPRNVVTKSNKPPPKPIRIPVIFKFINWAGVDKHNTQKLSDIIMVWIQSLGTVRPLYRTGVSLLTRENFLYI